MLNINEQQFFINKKQLYLDGILVSEIGYDIINPDEWFNEKYVIIFILGVVTFS
jgi:hypothetical protein